MLLGIYGDEDFITIATGTVQPLAKAPAVASIITADDIKRMGARDIDDVLHTVPGMHVSRDVLGYNPLYVVRGVYAGFNPQVLMLVDGVPLTNLFHGDRSQFWGGMPVEAISRIEVMRGPGSALYGAEAFAGVINIITKSAVNTPEGVEVGARLGNFSRREGWFSGRKDVGEWRMALTAEFGTDDTSYGEITRDSQSFIDSLVGTQASLAPGDAEIDIERHDLRFSALWRNWAIAAGHQFRSGDSTLGIAEALVDGNHFVSNRSSLSVKFEDAEFAHDWGVSGSVSYLHATIETDGDVMLFPPGSVPFFDPNGMPIGVFVDGVFGNPETFEHHWRGDLAANYSRFAGHQITFGTGYYYGDLYRVKESKNYGIDPSTGQPIAPIGFDPVTGIPLLGRQLLDVSGTPFVFLNGDIRKNHYFFVQDIWNIASGWELTAGLRYDHYSDFGSTVNPRLALVWSTTRNLTTKLLYGEAFRAPSFAETRSINNPVALGNPGLSPENLRSYEIAFDYRPNPDLNLVFNIFHYQWQDIIKFTPDGNGTTRTAQNSDEQTGRGFEVEAKWNVLPEWQLSGNFAYTHAEDKKTRSDAANFPQQHLYLRSYWQVSADWSLSLQASLVMDREREINDPRGSIDDYSLVDLTLRNRISPQVEAALIVKNLFDEDAREPTSMSDPVPFIPDDLPLPGRTVMGEVRFAF